jgi:hypothetical protein
MVLLSIPVGDPPHAACGIALGLQIQKVDKPISILRESPFNKPTVHTIKTFPPQQRPHVGAA